MGKTVSCTDDICDDTKFGGITGYGGGDEITGRPWGLGWQMIQNGRACTDGQIPTVLVLNCAQITKGGSEWVPGCVRWSQHNNMTSEFSATVVEVKYRYWIYQLRWLGVRGRERVWEKKVFHLPQCKKLIKLFSMGVLNMQMQRRKWNHYEMCMQKYIWEPETAWRICCGRVQPVQTYRTPHFGESVWTHSMSYSSPKSLLLLRQVSCRLVA